MIGRQEILDRAGEWNLRPEVVEKDYVLGWLLAAVSRHPVVREHWILKGGTCVKKCFFETYRFSEDLDFSLLPGAPYDAASIATTLQELAAATSDLSGIRFSPDQFTLKERRDKLGRPTFEGRAGYQGPLAVPSWPRILFDITQHEPVILPTTTRRILHPYSDTLPEDAGVRTYAFEELLAEKARALFERTRPRDLYDVAFILDNLEEPLDGALVRSTFATKCHAKEFEPPTAAAIVEQVRSSEELRADWDDMLAHQLPYVAPVVGAIERLERALAWLAQEQPALIVGTSVSLPTPAIVTGRVPAFATRSPQQSGVRRAYGSVFDILSFSGANRLLVGFDYSAKSRIVEPYSIRLAESTGNLNFYGWELATSQIKCFTISKMSRVRVLEETFAPRYHVELGSGVIARGRWRW